MNNTRAPKDAMIGIRVESYVKAAAERAAAEDYRSVASLIEKLLVEHLRKNGYLLSNGGAQRTAASGEHDAYAG